MQHSISNDRGFILLTALVVVTLSSVFAIASIRASQELLRFAQLKNAISKEQSDQLTKSIAESSTTNSSKRVSDSSTRRIGVLNKSYQRIYSIGAKHDDFPLLFDWSQFANLLSIQCNSKATSAESIFTAATTCNSLSSLNTIVNGNLTLSELEVSLPHSTDAILLIKGDLKINRLLLSGNSSDSTLQIFALGSAVINTLNVDSPHATNLLLYSETAVIEITSATPTDIACGLTTSSSNLKVSVASPHGASINSQNISAEKTAECAAKTTTLLKQGLIITGG